MDTIFMNSEERKTFDPQRLNLSNNLYVKRSDIYFALSKPQHLLYMAKYKKSLTKITNLKHQLQHGMKNLNYLMDHILYQIFKIVLNIS